MISLSGKAADVRSRTFGRAAPSYKLLIPPRTRDHLARLTGGPFLSVSQDRVDVGGFSRRRRIGTPAGRAPG